MTRVQIVSNAQQIVNVLEIRKFKPQFCAPPRPLRFSIRGAPDQFDERPLGDLNEDRQVERNVDVLRVDLSLVDPYTAPLDESIVRTTQSVILSAWLT